MRGHLAPATLDLAGGLSPARPRPTRPPSPPALLVFLARLEAGVIRQGEAIEELFRLWRDGNLPVAHLRLLIDWAWKSSDGRHLADVEWAELFRAARGTVPAEWTPLRVWRGGPSALGMSWSTDRDVAALYQAKWTARGVTAGLWTDLVEPEAILYKVDVHGEIVIEPALAGVNAVPDSDPTDSARWWRIVDADAAATAPTLAGADPHFRPALDALNDAVRIGQTDHPAGMRAFIDYQEVIRELAATWVPRHRRQRYGWSS